MPIWLRNFTFRKMSEFYEEQSKQANSSGNSNSTNDITKAREILQKAQRNDPRSKNPKDYQPAPKVNVPDFVTSAKSPSPSKRK